MNDDLNGLDSKINDRGFFERILKEFKETLAERQLRLDERFDAIEHARKIQAEEYARRLHDLNGEYQRDRLRQANYVSTEKYEDTLKSESTARSAALLRVDEKFEEYVKRYEVRQHEIDLLLSAQKGAADQAIKAAEDQGRKSNRNLGLASLALGLIVFIANILPIIIK